MIEPYKWALLGTLGVLGLSGVAQANVEMLNSQASFDSQVAAEDLDTLDSVPLSPAQSSGLTSPMSRSTAANTYSYSIAAASATLWGLASPSQPNDHWLSTNQSLTSLRFDSFNPGAVSAFGTNVFLTDASGVQVSNASIDVTVYEVGASAGQVFSLTSLDATTFVGFVSDKGLSAVSFSFVKNGAGGFGTVNNVRMGVALLPVPEPATYALMLGGLGLLAAVASRRRRA